MVCCKILHLSMIFLFEWPLISGIYQLAVGHIWSQDCINQNSITGTLIVRYFSIVLPLSPIRLSWYPHFLLLIPLLPTIYPWYTHYITSPLVKSPMLLRFNSRSSATLGAAERRRCRTVTFDAVEPKSCTIEVLFLWPWLPKRLVDEEWWLPSGKLT